jgi:hypothetical protein
LSRLRRLPLTAVLIFVTRLTAARVACHRLTRFTGVLDKGRSAPWRLVALIIDLADLERAGRRIVEETLYLGEASFFLRIARRLRAIVFEHSDRHIISVRTRPDDE